MSQEQISFEGIHSKQAHSIDVTAALKQMIDIMNNVEPESRRRLVVSLTTLFDLSQPTPYTSSGPGQRQEGIPFSEEKTVSPKEFVFQKKPNSDVERVTVLAYYLTHYRDTPYFKTLDISKLNTEAAQPKFSNAAYAVENATKLRYLVTASKGTKQLSAAGEVFVDALPDREAAKQARQAARPRRRLKRSSQSKEKSLNNSNEPDLET
jgi:hypothetical protein